MAHEEREVEPAALLAGWTLLARDDPEGAASRYSALIDTRHLDERAASPMGSQRPSASRGAASRARSSSSRGSTPKTSMTWRTSGTRARRSGPATGGARRRPSRRCRSRSAARTAGGTGRRARVKQRAIVTRRARDTRPSCPPTTGTPYCRQRDWGRFAPTLQEIELDKRAIDELAHETGFLRTRELLLCDLPSEAATEWQIAYELFTPAQQVQAIGLADRWGWHHQSIAAAAKQTLYNDYPLLYPRPYDKEVRAAARLADLPEELIYAVIRQESLYRADAGSSAGALGLMQLLPTTRDLRRGAGV